MAQNLVINGITYNGVESLEMTNDSGEKVLYTEGGSGGSSEVVIVECLNPEVSVDDDNTMTITGTPSIGFYDVAASIIEGGVFAVLKVVLEGDGTLYLPYATTGEDYTIIFAMADGQGGTAIGEFVRHADGTETITITFKPADDSGGAGEVNMNTCTVVIVPPSSSNYSVGREIVNAGSIEYKLTRNYTSGNITLATRCDSTMYIMASTIKGAEATGGEIQSINPGYGLAYKTPCESGASVQITLSA